MMRAVLVGTGWGTTHAAAYHNCKEVKLVGICGHRNVDRLNALADEYQIPQRSLNLDELLAKTEPDILDIATNPHYRLEGVRAAMIASIKLINVEKPLALTPREAYEIERLCWENNKLLTVNHQTKYLPAWRKTRDTIAAGKIGDIEFIRATCQGNLLEQGTHLIDNVLYFNDYASVSWVMGQIDELQGLDKASAAAPDAAMATICFDNGVRAMMTFGSMGHNLGGETNKWHQYAVEVYGSRGHIRVTLNKTLSITTYTDGKNVVEPASWDNNHVQAETAHLDDAARYAKNPAVGHISNLAKSLISFQVIMAIYSSGCGGGRIELPQRFDDQLMTRLHKRRCTIK